MSWKRLPAMAALVLMLAGSVRAGDFSTTSEGATWRSTFTGVRFDLAEDGSISRIWARQDQPVSVPDARGVRTAKIISEERAKADIVRFLNERVEAERVMKEFEKDLSLAQTSSGGKAPEALRKDTRKVVTSLEEVIRSGAAQRLSGVFVLDQGYDASAQMAWTVVGTSLRTQQGVAGFRQRMNGLEAAGSGVPAPAQSQAAPPQAW